MTQRRLLFVCLFVAIAVGAALLVVGVDGRGGARNVVRPAVEPVSGGAALAASAGIGARSEESAAEARRALGAERAEAGLDALASSATDASAARLLGRIVDERGDPVAGAAVRAAQSVSTFGLYEPTGFESHDAKIGVAATDSSGAFRIDCPSGPACLSIRAAGFVPRTVERLLLAAGGESTLDEDIVLERSAIVTGTVLDSTGAPLENARVVVRDAEGGIVRGVSRRELRTPADGSFQFAELPPRALTLLVRHESHTPESTAVDARQSGQLAPLAIRLKRGEVISGRCYGFPAEATDSIAVMAVPHSVLRGAGQEKRHTTVDEQGYFRLRGLSADSQWTVFALLAAKVSAIHPPQGNVHDRVSNAPVVDAGERNLVLEWEPSCAVRFRVVDANSRAPIESLAVGWGSHRHHQRSADPEDLEHYDDGLVRLAGLRSDDGEPLAIWIDAVNYAFWIKRDFMPEPGQEIDLGTIGLAPAPTMCITVVDDATGEPVAGAEVGWTEQDMTIAGEFAQALAASEGAPHAPWRRRSRGYGAHRTGVTDEHGFVSFEGRPGFIMELTVTAPGYASAHVADWQLPQAEAAERVVRLGQGGAVDVLLLDTEGEPLVGRTIEHRLFGLSLSKRRGSSVSERSEQATDAEGRARFQDLPPGGHEFRIGERELSGVIHWNAALQRVLQEAEGWTAVAVEAGAVSELELTEAPHSALFGRITDQGRPLARASVGLFAKSHPMAAEMVSFALEHNGRSMRTDADGRYRIDNVEPGDYVLVIQHTDYRTPFDRAVTVPSGEVRCDVELGTAVLAGRVVDERGKAVADAVVVVAASDDGRAWRYQRSFRKSSAGLALVIELHGVGEVRTDHDGAWEVRGLEPGIALVAMTGGGLSAGLPACSEELTLSPGQRLVGIELVVHPAGSLVVRYPVTLSRSEYSASLTLSRTIDTKKERISGGFSGDTGTIDGLPPGSWTLSVRTLRPRESTQEHEIEIVAGETTYLDLALPE
ncbi:MAG: carboxypeptidase-like regulatory domain-containing protein [Planctomycetota bacterium]